MPRLACRVTADPGSDRRRDSGQDATLGLPSLKLTPRSRDTTGTPLLARSPLPERTLLRLCPEETRWHLRLDPQPTGIPTLALPSLLRRCKCKASVDQRTCGIRENDSLRPRRRTPFFRPRDARRPRLLLVRPQEPRGPLCGHTIMDLPGCVAPRGRIRARPPEMGG